MDFELKAAKEKWEREQKQRKEQAIARLQREKKAKEEAAQQREALEAALRHRRLQEAEAAAAAKHQEESDLLAGDGIRFSVVFQATLVAGDGDKIKLPPSAFELLSSEGALEKGPMFFEISVGTDPPVTSASDEMPDAINTRNTHAGVLQFTAPEGYAELPPHVWKNAGLPEITTSLAEGPFIRIRYVRLPKCTYAKLLPEASDFSDVPNHKAVLETKLRQHATLSEGDLLLVQHGGMDYCLRVLDLKPASSVSVLETDMEVDVVQAAIVPGTSSQSRLIPLEIGKPENGFVEEGGNKYYKFSIDEKLLDAANKGDMELIVHLEINGEGTTSDADLYVAAHPVMFPTQHQHQWASHDLGTKIIHLTGAGKTLQSSSYSIGVYGFRGVASYKIWVQSQPSGQAAGQRVGFASFDGQGDSHMQAGFELCGNCRQVIPSRTIALHEAYCRRHNAVCEYPGCGVVLRREEFKKHVHCSKCGQSLQQEELGKHLKVYHEPQPCRCGAMLERDEMVKHLATSCPLRTIMCRFCGDMVQAGTEAENIRDKLRGLTQHESLCGSRTAPCELCGRSVMLKEMDLHTAAAHDPNSKSRITHTSALMTSPGYNAMADAVEPVSTANPPSLREQFKVLKCPICSLTFEGVSADGQLNGHLDSDHFSEISSSTSTGHVHGPEALHGPEAPSYVPDTSFRSSLSVSCPICGLAVHSERDLSLHMDMVH